MINVHLELSYLMVETLMACSGCCTLFHIDEKRGVVGCALFSEFLVLNPGVIGLGET